MLACLLLVRPAVGGVRGARVGGGMLLDVRCCVVACEALGVAVAYAQASVCANKASAVEDAVLWEDRERDAVIVQCGCAPIGRQRVHIVW